MLQVNTTSTKPIETIPAILLKTIKYKNNTLTAKKGSKITVDLKTSVALVNNIHHIDIDPSEYSPLL